VGDTTRLEAPGNEGVQEILSPFWPEEFLICFR